VILLTARQEHGDVMESLQAGADDYVPKPFDRETLRERVRAGVRSLEGGPTIVRRIRRLVEAADRLAREARDLLDTVSRGTRRTLDA
jgi:DNA-binding response OmpR family regulator